MAPPLGVRAHLRRASTTVAGREIGRGAARQPRAARPRVCFTTASASSTWRVRAELGGEGMSNDAVAIDDERHAPRRRPKSDLTP